MQCDEIQKHIIDLVYDEGGIQPLTAEIKEHLRTCSACREEIGELRQTRKYLQLWKEESLPRSATTIRPQSFPGRVYGWRILRYAAIAAMIAISILAAANTRIVLNKNGFSFSAHLIPLQDKERDYYTKTELRNLLKLALDDSESRTNEMSYLMMQKMLDTVEEDRWAFAPSQQIYRSESK